MHWTGGDTKADQALGGTHVGFRFDSTVEVGCVSVCQSIDKIQQVWQVTFEDDIDGKWSVNAGLAGDSDGRGPTLLDFP